MEDVNQTRNGKTRKRASTPRSKTGCVTCKIRRLKCGEERPSCHRCVRSGWQCDGYDHVSPTLSPPTGGLRGSMMPRTPPLSPLPSSLLMEPSMLLFLDDREQYYFQNCGDEVEGQFQGHDIAFWRSLALQESTTSFSVRHGMVAIGALKKSAIKRSGRYQMDAVPGRHREFALQQYHKAIQGLRESIPNLEDEVGVRSTLVCCMVLAIFDDFIGQRAFALQHMRYAREILVNTNVLLPATLALGDLAGDNLTSMFLRLDVLALCATGIDEHRTCIPFNQNCPGITVPPRLSSFEEARNLSSLVSWEGYMFFYNSAKYQLLPRNQIPPALIRLRERIIKQLYDVIILLSNLKSEPQDTLLHPLARVEALALHPTLVLIRLVSGLGAPETACDVLLPQFNYLLNLSRETLQYEALENPAVMGAETYHLETRTILPLLLIATKCRNSPLRLEAISLLLSSHRREWMYDSLLSGQIGEWMMSIEEEGMDTNGYIPEHSRAWGESVELDLQGRKAKVKCRQNFRSRVSGKVEWRWREKHVVW
ncbi:uncharacterized protein PAC_02374 [Phialocephala subalpina]|uniref:Zn(2)-C6 fungal-type domain-containing protein n=1 Tax=Phialocephala subalpina TaxID=576137 RepID=A0A1L7WIB9_9HELO|nr:uncharacterized protein PAC_02374 [Phialocephala subalpina]